MELKKRLVLEFSQGLLKAVLTEVRGAKAAVKKILIEPSLGIDSQSISRSLSGVLAQVGGKRKLEIILVLPRDKLTVRRIELPSHDPHEIEQMLELSVVRQVPYRKEEIIWAYQNLGFDGISNSQILLVIAQREIFKDVFNSFSSLGILTDKIVMSSQGVSYYLSTLADPSSRGGTHLILDIDYHFSDLMLVHNGKLHASVCISQGSAYLENEQNRERFGEELKRALVAFLNDVPSMKPGRIFITGGSQQDLALVESSLGSDFDLKCQYLKAKDLQDIKAQKAQEVSCAAVLGFSYQNNKDDITFLLPEVQIKKGMQVKTQQLFTLGISLVYIFLLLGAVIYLRFFQLQNYRDRTQEQFSQLKKNTSDLASITRKIKLVRFYADPKESVLTYLYEFIRLCPDSITLTNLNWEWQKSFTIRGYALQIPDVLNFVNSLNTVDFFKGAKNSYTRRRKVNDRELVDFEIKIR